MKEQQKDNQAPSFSFSKCLFREKPNFTYSYIRYTKDNKKQTQADNQERSRPTQRQAGENQFYVLVC